ncbi:MAG: hypothetical protein Q8J99_16160, partial [Sulfuritalea sp.]|nr:hypothetical protein [Sulfuritalea sp.]
FVFHERTPMFVVENSETRSLLQKAFQLLININAAQENTIHARNSPGQPFPGFTARWKPIMP